MSRSVLTRPFRSILSLTFLIAVISVMVVDLPVASSAVNPKPQPKLRQAGSRAAASFPPTPHPKGIVSSPAPPAMIVSSTAPPAPTAPTGEPSVSLAEFAAWSKVNECEEDGAWHVRGTVFSGGLGISNTNWVAYGGTQFAPDAADATPAEQIMVAQRIQPIPPDQNGCSGSW